MNSTNSGNVINHSSINWAQFKDPLCYLHLAGTVVESWSLTQEVAGSNNFFKKYTIFLSQLSWYSSIGRVCVYGMIGPSYQPHQYPLVGMWKRSAHLSCWLPKKSAGVALEVNLRGHVTHVPLPSVNNTAQRRHHQKSKRGVSVAP